MGDDKHEAGALKNHWPFLSGCSITLNLMLLLMSWLPFMNSFSLPRFSVTTGKAWCTVVRKMLTRDWMRVCG